MKNLICDSGGTKSSWILTDNAEIVDRFCTEGMNPAVTSHDDIRCVLSVLPSLLKGDGNDVDRVWFYGAGCTHGTAAKMQKMLSEVMPKADVSVESDMLGAARALCQNEEGIACILGTGANSCYYDGYNIRQNTPSLGYILGDEGGGAVLGRMLINRLYKGIFPQRLKTCFEEEMNTDLNTIIEYVYRRPMANRYLASFSYFIASHRDEDCIHGMLTHCFTQFFQRNIRVYGRSDLDVHFVGSLAFHFRDELNESAVGEGFRIGKIIQAPIEYLAQYHIIS